MSSKKTRRQGRRGKNGSSVVNHLLELGSLKGLRAAKEATQQLIDYHWTLYSELAFQRSQIEEDLKAALNEAAIGEYPFAKWQRAVQYRFSLHPFCVNGSLSDPGGRFNVGDIDHARYPQFPALYIAADKDTALQETLGQVAPVKGSKLTAQEIALANPQSQTIVSVSGTLETVIDLREPQRLKKFVNLMKEFTLSTDLKWKAKQLEIDSPDVVKTASKLVETLLVPNWRSNSMSFDVPANPQLFGHLVFLAGIEGILYPSKLTNKECLAIFPRNFQDTSSFVELDDAAPDSRVPKRLDSENWKLSEKAFEEICRSETRG
jgi:hypothetical protein